MRREHSATAWVLALAASVNAACQGGLALEDRRGGHESRVSERGDAKLGGDPRPDPRPFPDFPHDAIRPSDGNLYLPGSAGVNGAGAATYTIPLAVPPGVRGMQPALSLVYSSKGENGIAGVGWSLTGASTIAPCRKTL